MSNPIKDFIYHYHNGSSTHAWEHMGCHPENRDGQDGFVFRVWAPNAQKVAVVGDFNFWNGEDLLMQKISRRCVLYTARQNRYGLRKPMT